MQTKFRQDFYLVFLFSSLILSGCKDEDYSKFINSEGYKLYSGKCSSCHQLIPPKDKPIEKFKEYIERYGKGMTEDERSKLEEFIEAVQKENPK